MSASKYLGRKARMDPDRMKELKVFYADFVTPENLKQRRKELKENPHRRSKVFSFVDINAGKIGEDEVELEANFHFTLGFIASFAHCIPPQIEVEECLFGLSLEHRLNDHFKTRGQHRAWARTEAGLHRALGAYILNRNQRNQACRKGRERMETLKQVARARLEDHGLLENGKKKPTRGKNAAAAREAEKKEAESATGSAGDTADTLPLPDDHHQQILDHMLQEEELEAEEMFDFIINGSQAEGGEEEERERDEVVEAVVDHEDSNNYADVGDDDDDDAMTPAQSKEAAAAKTPPEAPKKQAARSKAKATELAAPQPDDEAEEVASDGEGDGQTSKGTHKDTKALTQLPSLPAQTSLDQAEKLCASLESDSQADLLKAQRKVRQSVRASLAGDGDEDEEEDRDKKLNEEIEANEGGTKGKGKGRGRGRGLMRPAAAIKTDAVAPQSSKKTEPSGDECEDDIPATQPDSDEPDQVDVPEVQPKKKKTQGKSPVASPKPAPASKKKDTSTKNAKPSKPSIKPPKKESPKLTKNAVPKKKPSKRTVEEEGDGADTSDAIKKFKAVLPLPELHLPANWETRKTLTVQASSDIQEATSYKLSTIGISFLAGSYYVSPVETDFITKLNGELEDFPDLKVNRKKGCTISWNRFSTPDTAWDVALLVAGWRELESEEEPGD